MQTHHYHATSSLLCLRPACVYELFSFSSEDCTKMHVCATGLRQTTQNGMPSMSTCSAAHASRLLFQPGVGSLPSARHSSHVIGFLKSNLLPAFLRNCDRGKLRSHTWHMMGFAAASTDACSFFAVKPPALSCLGIGQHSLHLMLIPLSMRCRQSPGQKKAMVSVRPHCVQVSHARAAARLRSLMWVLFVLPPSFSLLLDELVQLLLSVK